MFFFSGCRERTEIVLGAATDLKARNQVDEVRLVVSQRGVPILQPKPWSLSEVPSGVFELPGSFGLYSPDGSAVRLEIALTGFKNQVVVVERDTILSLVPGQTLFTRLTLVSDCSRVDGPRCASSQACVEGVCREKSVDARGFPRHRKDLERALECQSGFNYVISSTGLPMPLLGAGCAAGQSCSEGTCYGLAGAGPDGGVAEGVWTESLTPASSLLHAVWQSPDGKDVFAVGDAGTILHWTDAGPTGASGWVREESPIAANLHAVWGTGVDKLFAAGTFVGEGGILLRRSMSGAWTRVENLPPTASLRGGAIAPGGEIVLAGTSDGMAGEILRGDGVTFTRDTAFAGAAENFPTQLRAIAIGRSGEIWVAGTGGVVGRFDGNAWTLQLLEGAGDLRAVIAEGPGEAHVVGQGGFIARIAGAQITVEESPTTVDLLGLAPSGPDELVAVGDYGTILRRRGGAWVDEPSGTRAPLFAVFAAPASSLEFAVGSLGTIRSFAKVPCGADADCDGNFYCDKSGRCALRKDVGAGGTCDFARDCISAASCRECRDGLSCTDGYCCRSSSCAGACESCGPSGDCAPLPLGSAPNQNGGGCPSSESSCAALACDGVSRTCLYPTGACGAANCDNDIAVAAAQCKDGACVPGARRDCSPYDCAGGACASTCTTSPQAGCAADSQCYDIGGDGPPEYVCLKNDAAMCMDGAQCRAGHCSKGQCCDTDCNVYCSYPSGTVYLAPTCTTGTCTQGGTPSPCPNGLQCSGSDGCYDYCYTVWVGGFPSSGFPTGLNFGGCASGTPYCNCVPASSGGNCQGTRCCASFPCN